VGRRVPARQTRRRSETWPAARPTPPAAGEEPRAGGAWEPGALGVAALPGAALLRPPGAPRLGPHASRAPAPPAFDRRVGLRAPDRGLVPSEPPPRFAGDARCAPRLRLRLGVARPARLRGSPPRLRACVGLSLPEQVPRAVVLPESAHPGRVSFGRGLPLVPARRDLARVPHDAVALARAPGGSLGFAREVIGAVPRRGLRQLVLRSRDGEDPSGSRLRASLSVRRQQPGAAVGPAALLDVLAERGRPPARGARAACAPPRRMPADDHAPPRAVPRRAAALVPARERPRLQLGAARPPSPPPGHGGDDPLSAPLG
jgi:hypothetical protein